MSVLDNVSFASLNKVSKFGVIDHNKRVKYTNGYIDAMNIKTPSYEQAVGNLSGGNQQKVALAKWLMTEPKVLILDEPTRGIDVGAKHEIYTIMNQLIEQGVCIVMISSDLPEILGMSDRIIVMREGKIAGELCNIEDFTQEKVMYYATGGGNK